MERCECGCAREVKPGKRFIRGHQVAIIGDREKWCARCQSVRFEEEFAEDRQARDGLRAWCDDCNGAKSKDWYVKNSERGKASAQKWAQENPERVREFGRVKRAKNPEAERARVREAMRLARERETSEEREARLAERRAQYAENPEHFRQSSKDWRNDNPEKLRETQRRGNAKRDRVAVLANAKLQKAKRKRGFKYAEHVDPLVVLERYDGVCELCGEDVDPFNFQIDHIIPPGQGGFHNYENTRPAHGTTCRNSEGLACNQSRSRTV